jgi:hypothetical protein
MRYEPAALPARSRQALPPHRSLLLLGWLLFSTGGAVLGTIQAAYGVVSGFGGSATYTGQLGPVSAARTICVCLSADPNLSTLIGCLEVGTNGGTYFARTFNMNTYYVVAFLDLDANIELDTGEPYVIYNGKNAPPGDPVVAGLAQTGIDFSFGDENIWPPSAPPPTETQTPTHTPTLSPTDTETPTSTPTETDTPTPAPTDTETPTSTPTPPLSPTPTPSPTSTLGRQCPGDCDGNGNVTVAEIVVLVNIALGNAQLSSCMPGDADDSHDVTIDEIVAAVNAALSGCN